VLTIEKRWALRAVQLHASPEDRHLGPGRGKGGGELQGLSAARINGQERPLLLGGIGQGGAEVRPAPDQDAYRIQDLAGLRVGGEGQSVMDRPAGQERTHGANRRGPGDP
jgi:hypothetical protein